MYYFRRHTNCIVQRFPTSCGRRQTSARQLLSTREGRTVLAGFMEDDALDGADHEHCHTTRRHAMLFALVANTTSALVPPRVFSTGAVHRDLVLDLIQLNPSHVHPSHDMATVYITDTLANSWHSQMCTNPAGLPCIAHHTSDAAVCKTVECK